MDHDNDKKRLHEDSDNSEIKKHKPLDVLSEDGPLTQKDVVYFKKEAIWRQMRSYKQKCTLLTRDLNDIKLNYESNERKINVLDSWYELIINLFGVKTELNVELNETILIKLTNVPIGDLDALLEKRRAQLLTILSPIIENSKLSNIDKSDVLEKIEVLNAEVATLKSENNTLSKLKSQFESKVEDLQAQLLTLVKDNDRRSSKTLRRIDESLTNGSDVKEEASETVKSEVNKDTTVKNENSVDNEEFERISSEIEELKNDNRLLKELMNQINTNYDKVVKENLQLSDKLENLNENDLINSVSYQELAAHNKELNESVNNLQKINDTTVNKLNELENKQTNVKHLLDKELREENETLKQQLQKSENDLVRIRTARDELLSKQTILKADFENQTTNDELNKLNKVLNNRINALESERHETGDNSKINELSKDELIQRINMLNSEIKEIEQAFQETRENSLSKLMSVTDQENMVKKLTIEKTKADQKYFASMRLKDSLSSENKILKTQINKSQELVSKLNDLEKSYLDKIEILTKSNNDFKIIRQSALQENSKLQESLRAIDVRKASLEKELSGMKDKYSDKVQETTSFTQELNEKNLMIGKLEHKLKSTESLLKKYKTNNTSSILQEDERQLEALRSIAKCSVCSKNWKDTAITVCGHVFCLGCTQERLAARLRRCPTCNKGFSANDLLSIHL